MEIFDSEEINNEIVIEKLVPDEDGNLRATLLIPAGNRMAFKLFYETFFERIVRDAHLKFTPPPKDKKP